MLNTGLQHTKSIVERSIDFVVRPHSFGRIRRTPVQFLGLTGEEGTAFPSRLIADGDHQIERLIRKLVPRLTARLTRINIMPFESCKCFRVNIAGWKASRAPCPIAATAEVIDQSFSHDRTAGIPRAQHEDLRCLRDHQLQHPAVAGEGSQQLGLPIVSGVQQAA
jgi:hypothetical protein